MRKQLFSFVCIGGLSATGLLLWYQPARAADDVRTTDVVSPGPKFAEETLNISKDTTVKWVPKTDPGVPHHFVQKLPNGKDGPEITPEFTNPDAANKATHKFGTTGVFKIQCIIHRATMNQTITVE